MIEQFKYEDFKNENNYISANIIKVNSNDKYYSSIDVKVTNRTNHIINVSFTNHYFITYNKIQFDIFHSANIHGKILRLEILPNVSKFITLNLSTKNYEFNQMDLVISKFIVNNSENIIGYRVGNVVTDHKINSDFIPLKNSKKIRKQYFGCLILITLLLIILVAAIILN